MVLVECAEAARLLGIAWVGAGLYPDPASQDAFRRVALDLAKLTEPIDFEPGPEDLKCRRQPIEDLGAALKRLATTAFGHKVAVIRLHPDFSPEHLAMFLQLLAVEPSALERIGGLASAVRARDLVGIEVALQTSLVDAVPGGASSDALAVSLLVRNLGDLLPVEGAASYVEQLADVVHHQPEQVAAHLEAFTRLDKSVQEAIVERLMNESKRELQELFLDQLAGHELAELGATLGSQAATFLADYVEYSTGHRGVEAEAAALDPDSLLTFRTEVAARVNSRLQELELTGFTQHIEMPPKSMWADAAQETLRGLFKVEERPERRGRAARAWNRLVLASVRRGSFAEGLGWYRSGLDLRSADEGLWTSEHVRMADLVIPTLAVAMANGSEQAGELLRLLTPGSPAALVNALEQEELDGRREVLTGALATWLQGDVEPILCGLSTLDRAIPALMVALRKSGADVGADGRVRDRLTDPRPEVRLLAIELCGRDLSREELAGFVEDSSGQIRRHVLRLLSIDASPGAVAALAVALKSAQGEEKVAVASALARSTDGAAFLRSLRSGWRAVLTSEGRANRALVDKVLRR